MCARDYQSVASTVQILSLNPHRPILPHICVVIGYEPIDLISRGQSFE